MLSTWSWHVLQTAPICSTTWGLLLPRRLAMMSGLQELTHVWWPYHAHCRGPLSPSSAWGDKRRIRRGVNRALQCELRRGKKGHARPVKTTVVPETITYGCRCGCSLTHNNSWVFSLWSLFCFFPPDLHAPPVATHQSLFSSLSLSRLLTFYFLCVLFFFSSLHCCFSLILLSSHLSL